ncbi:MAG TPA: 2-succinyl-6-hydroxy-2,4-cyclohexadiene-1-carboxylate synthase [Solirubrobacter sp.]|nr:2-succinyl-6-hydroxy-2,4-cyclohexadiene-1-carboxylate synthase [Solirubrobacter sp.]
MNPELVLLHGFTQTRQSWRRTIQALAGRYRAITPDLPGHGQAVHRTASFDACAAYIRALQPRVLGGYSMGGRIALYAALTVPGIERLVLVGASPGIADPAERAARRAADEALAARIETMSIEEFAREWGSQPLFAGQPERVAAAAYADRLRNTPAGLAAALRGLGTGVMEPLWERLGELTMPVTLITGERDEKFRAIAEAMLARLPDARHVIVPGAGHAPQLEAPDLVAAAIR